MSGPASNGDGADLKKARRRSPPLDLVVHRALPNSPEAEQGLLGCVVMDFRLRMPAVQAHGILPHDFYDLRHQTVWESLAALAEEPNSTADVITLMEHLNGRKMLEQVGGIAFLNQLQDVVPSSANWSYYADIVQEKSLLRRAIHFATDLVASIHNHAGEVDELLDQIEHDALTLRRRRAGGRVLIREAVAGALAAMEDKFTRGAALKGLSTGFVDLDNVLDGLCPGELIVPAAFPSAGKTSLAMNFVEHAVLGGDFPVAVFSLEMTTEQLVTRMLCSGSRVNGRRLPEMSQVDFERLGALACRLSASKLHIVDDMDSIGQIVAESRRLHHEHGVKLVVVDYIQIVTREQKRDENREQQVSAIAATLKRLAKELNVPVVAPSQLNEDGALRESKAIGQHCDVVLMLEPEEDSATADAESVSVLVKKNRNGPRDVRVPLTFLKMYTRFESAAKVDESY